MVVGEMVVEKWRAASATTARLCGYGAGVITCT